MNMTTRYRHVALGLGTSFGWKHKIHVNMTTMNWDVALGLGTSFEWKCKMPMEEMLQSVVSTITKNIPLCMSLA